VPSDVAGSTTLLTNLANRVQPLIRYDLGDRITLHGKRCECGSHLPAIEVEGRCDDTLLLGASDDKAVRVLPLALSTVLEDDAGLFDFQLEQLSASELELRTSLEGEPADRSLRRARAVLVDFLGRQGATGVRISTCSGEPNRRGAGGKIRRVMAMQR
jgi:phenylacetate-coenzyme A ligase PaaK-like adenylate-forming protein